MGKVGKRSASADCWPLRKMAFMHRREREWHLAWKELADRSGDQDMVGLDPESGEVWQYMDSAPIGPRGRWVHEFRHRWHPVLHRRWYVRIPASRGWPPPGRRRF